MFEEVECGSHFFFVYLTILVVIVSSIIFIGLARFVYSFIDFLVGLYIHVLIFLYRNIRFNVVEFHLSPLSGLSYSGFVLV